MKKINNILKTNLALIFVGAISINTYANGKTNSANSVEKNLKNFNFQTSNPTIQSSSTSICAGSSVSLELLNMDENSTCSWRYTTGSAVYLNFSHETTVIVSPSVTTTYTATITSADGTTTSLSATITVSNPNIEVNASSEVVCLGNSITLTASSTTTIPDENFEWSTSTVSSPVLGKTLTITPTSVYDCFYSVTVTSPEGCSTTLGAKFIVRESPTISTTNTQICLGNFVTLSSNSTSSQNSWKDNNGVVIGSGASLSFSPTANYSYTVTNEYGCTSPSQSIIVSPNPIVAITSNASSICLGETITLTTTSTISNTDFSWSNSSNANAIISVYYEFTPTAT